MSVDYYKEILEICREDLEAGVPSIFMCGDENGLRSFITDGTKLNPVYVKHLREFADAIENGVYD